jgi:hypothetical protein
VSLDAGVSISWEPDPETGSIEAGMQHHRDEEEQFLRLIDAATAAIEVLFDELESAGRRFKPPSSDDFYAQAQHARTGMPIVELRVWSAPAFSEGELQSLVERIAKLIDARAD